MKKLLTYLSVMLLFAAYSCHTETDIQVSSMLKDGICINSIPIIFFNSISLIFAITILFTIIQQRGKI